VAELNQAGLVQMQGESELLEPPAHRIPEAPGVGLVLEADYKVSRLGNFTPGRSQDRT